MILAKLLTFIGMMLSVPFLVVRGSEEHWGAMLGFLLGVIQLWLDTWLEG